MTARSIQKADWGSFCAAVSEALEGSDAEIEVASIDLGQQVEKQWAPLIGISYDPEDDIIDIALEEVDHIVNEPKELLAEIDDARVSALQITDGEGTRHLVRLKNGLMLPSAH
jgi:hypothetical protein